LGARETYRRYDLNNTHCIDYQRRDAQDCSHYQWCTNEQLEKHANAGFFFDIPNKKKMKPAKLINWRGWSFRETLCTCSNVLKRALFKENIWPGKQNYPLPFLGDSIEERDMAMTTA
jgi:hypothetical protein